jgi:hypothetical protein
MLLAYRAANTDTAVAEFQNGPADLTILVRNSVAASPRRRPSSDTIRNLLKNEAYCDCGAAVFI